MSHASVEAVPRSIPNCTNNTLFLKTEEAGQKHQEIAASKVQTYDLLHELGVCRPL